MKYCPGCKTTKSLQEFGKNSAYADGKSRYCIVCWREIQRTYYAKTSKAYNAKRRDRYANDPAYRKRVLEGNNKSRNAGGQDA